MAFEGKLRAGEGREAISGGEWGVNVPQGWDEREIRRSLHHNADEPETAVTRKNAVCELRR